MKSLTDLLMTDQAKEVLSKVSQSDDVAHEFDSSILQRYQNFLLEIREESSDPHSNRFKEMLKWLEIILVPLSGLFGYVFSQLSIRPLYLAIFWGIYIAILIIVSSANRLIPTDLKLLNEKATNIRLINLCERLAGQLALFDLIYDDEAIEEDEYDIIEKVSEGLPDYDDLSEEDQETIQRCLNTDATFNNSRETNISIDELDLDDRTANRLNRATKEIRDLCSSIFAGDRFTVKLYLRTQMEVDSERSVEILTSFTKYPAASDRPLGSSWVEARGNPSIVWQALESGQPNHIAERGIGEYYDSVLAIPLPGRIGVLGITSARVDAFENKDDELSVRALAVASRANALQALGISDT